MHLGKKKGNQCVSLLIWGEGWRHMWDSTALEDHLLLGTEISCLLLQLA